MRNGPEVQSEAAELDRSLRRLCAFGGIAMAMVAAAGALRGQEREYGSAAGSWRRAAAQASAGQRTWYEDFRRPWYTIEPRLPWYSVYPRQPWYGLYPYAPWYSHFGYRYWGSYGGGYWGWPYSGLLYRPWHAPSYSFYRPWCAAGDRWWGGYGLCPCPAEELELYPRNPEWDGDRRSYGGICDW